MLWVLVRAAIFILAWIVFAISFFFTFLLLIAITGIALILNTFLDLNINAQIDELVVEGDIDLSYRYEITEFYIEFFDLYIPKISTYLNISNFTIVFSICLFSINLEFTEFPDDIFNIFDNGPEQSADNSTISYTPLFSDLCNFISGIGLAMATLGTLVGIQAGLLSFIDDPVRKNIIFGLGLILFIFSTIILIILIFVNPETTSPWSLLGIGIGFIISGISFFALRKYIKDTFQYKAWFIKGVGGDDLFLLYGILDVIFAAMDVCLGIGDLKGTYYEGDESYLDMQNKAQFSLGVGIFSLFLSTEAIIFLNKRYRDDKSKLSALYGGGSLILGLFFIGLAFWKFYEEAQ